jgi:hypothetical protein
MKSWLAICSAIAVAGLSGVSWAAEEGEEHDTTVTQSELPARVAEAVKEYGKGGEFVSAVKGDEDGVPVYEVTLNKDGKKIEVQTTLDGELNMREEAVEPADLPKAALARIRKEHPGSQVHRVEKTIRSSYEVQVTDASGKKSEVLVTPGGQLTTEPEELDGKKGGEEVEEKDEKDEKAGKAERHKGEGAERGAKSEKHKKSEKGEKE